MNLPFDDTTHLIETIWDAEDRLIFSHCRAESSLITCSHFLQNLNRDRIYEPIWGWSLEDFNKKLDRRAKSLANRSQVYFGRFKYTHSPMTSAASEIEILLLGKRFVVNSNTAEFATDLALGITQSSDLIKKNYHRITMDAGQRLHLEMERKLN